MTKEEKDKYGDKCPECRTEWDFTPRIVCAGNWVHCTKCEKKADQILEEKKEKSDTGYESLNKLWSGGVDWGHRK